MEWHQKIQYKLKNFMYAQNRKKQHKTQKVETMQHKTAPTTDFEGIDKQPIQGNMQGIKHKIDSALGEMDDYLGEQIQQHLHKKDKTK